VDGALGYAHLCGNPRQGEHGFLVAEAQESIQGSIDRAHSLRHVGGSRHNREQRLFRTVELDFIMKYSIGSI
jgi:hypothetical protein